MEEYKVPENHIRCPYCRSHHPALLPWKEGYLHVKGVTVLPPEADTNKNTRKGKGKGKGKCKGKGKGTTDP